MAFLQWKEEYSVQVTELDQQHRKLIDLINQLHDAMATGSSSKVMGEILNELYQYTQTHFSTEEQLFRQYNYPGELVHKVEHQKFIEKVNSVQQKYQKSQMGLSTDLMIFLKDWLTHHILETDQRYSSFLNKQGVH